MCKLPEVSKDAILAIRMPTAKDKELLLGV